MEWCNDQSWNPYCLRHRWVSQHQHRKHCTTCTIGLSKTARKYWHYTIGPSLYLVAVMLSMPTVVTAVCPCVSFSAWYLKNGCSWDHQTWHANISPGVLETHLFLVQKVKGKDHEGHNASQRSISQHYNLRSRRHTLQLPEHHTRLLDSNFLVRMLYKDCY